MFIKLQINSCNDHYKSLKNLKTEQLCNEQRNKKLIIIIKEFICHLFCFINFVAVFVFR